MAGAPRVEIKTSIGTVVVELYTAHAPQTCKNFLELARRGYYNSTVACLLLAQCLPSLLLVFNCFFAEAVLHALRNTG